MTIQAVRDRQHDAPPRRPEEDVPFGSNEIRLSPCLWLITSGVMVALTYLVPILWTRVEPLRLTRDYRVPFRLSHDYWMIHRYCRQIRGEQRTLVLGDSVVWGHYVHKDQTLSHYLNQLSGGSHFTNLGVDGTHPAALAGLVEYYGQPIRHRRVLLHCNLLWISSPRHDLTREKESSFNHPQLVPQFIPRVPCYRESLSTRLGIVVGRHVPLLGWVDHMRIAYFQDTDLPTWTLEHPYGNPARAITLRLPPPDEPPWPPPVAEPWTAQRLRPFDPPWVELKTSLQWNSFQRVIKTLRGRGNRVYVLVGPLNEHMLDPSSRQVYEKRRKQVEAWLQARGIPFYAPAALASQQYADASHPLADGYRSLAEQLWQQPSLRQFHTEADSRKGPNR